MSIGYNPKCYTCKWFDDWYEGFRCDAFPNGIPRDIILGDVDHTSPYFNDNGKQYQYEYKFKYENNSK